LTAPIDPPNEDDGVEPTPPSRPALVELAAAVLVVGGVIGFLGVLAALPGVPPGAEPVVVGTIALDVGSIALGVLVRFGRAWILAVNYAAVLGFLDLLGAGESPLALMLGLADIAVVGILLSHKPWFDATRAWRTNASQAARTTRISP